MHFVSIFTFISCLLDVLAAPQRSTEQGRGNSDNINSIEPVDTSGDSNSNVNSSGNGSGPIIEANPEPDTEADPITSQEVDPVVEIEEPIDDASSNPRGEGGVVLPDDSAFPQFGENEVSPQMLNDFILYREFSAITFCPENNDSPGGPLSAAPADTENGCPRIAATLSNMKTVLEFENTPKTDTTGYLVTSHLHKKHILAFRGTRSVQNVVADLKFVPIETDICPDCTAGRGFWSSWLDARDIVREGMKEAVEEFPEYEIVVTGHSLGGAVASLAAAQLRNDGYDVALYTFGAPRIGGVAISDYISKQPGGNFRVTHQNDPVPRLPPIGTFDYVHISPEFFISTPDQKPVIPSDIKVLEGNFNRGGNSGSGIPSWPAHKFYFENMDQCCASNFPVSPLLALLQG